MLQAARTFGPFGPPPSLTFGLTKILFCIISNVLAHLVVVVVVVGILVWHIGVMVMVKPVKLTRSKNKA